MIRTFLFRYFLNINIQGLILYSITLKGLFILIFILITYLSFMSVVFFDKSFYINLMVFFVFVFYYCIINSTIYKFSLHIYIYIYIYIYIIDAFYHIVCTKNR